MALIVPLGFAAASAPPSQATCDAPSTTPTRAQVSRVDYGDAKRIVDRKLDSHGSLAFRGTKFTTYDYGIADCVPGWATVTFGSWQKALRVVTVKWVD